MLRTQAILVGQYMNYYLNLDTIWKEQRWLVCTAAGDSQLNQNSVRQQVSKRQLTRTS